MADQLLNEAGRFVFIAYIHGAAEHEKSAAR